MKLIIKSLTVFFFISFLLIRTKKKSGIRTMEVKWCLESLMSEIPFDEVLKS